VAKCGFGGEFTKRDIPSHLLLLHRWASVVARTWAAVVGILRRAVDTALVRRIRLEEGLEEGNNPDLEGVGTIVADTEGLRRRNLYLTFYAAVSFRFSRGVWCLKVCDLYV